MNRQVVLPLFCVVALMLTRTAGVARVVVRVGPPPPVVEALPAPPAPGYVWQPGYWAWNGVQYVWVPGRYVVAPFSGAVWIPGHWLGHGGVWEWRAGHWRR
jgi:hypothetical protein